MNPPIHFEVSRMFEEELQPGETLRWSGAPIPNRSFLRTLPILLFAIPWTAFAVFWMVGASGFKIPDFRSGFSFFPFFGIPFLLVGFAMLSSPYWAKRKARRTGYFVTDKRAVLIEKRIIGGYSIRSFYPQQLGDIERIQRADGSGDLILARDYRTDSEGSRNVTKIGFFGIPEVREVEGFIQQIRA